MNAPATPAEPNGQTYRDWRQWVFSQGASTVLLFALALGCWRAIPMVTTSFETLDAKHESRVKEMQQEHRAHVQSIVDTFKQERQLEREQAKETIAAMRESTTQIRQATGK